MGARTSRPAPNPKRDRGDQVPEPELVPNVSSLSGEDRRSKAETVMGLPAREIARRARLIRQGMKVPLGLSHVPLKRYPSAI